MSRLLAAVLVLCAQVLAIFATGNLVVCVHDDGECAIELVGSECCRAAHEADERRPLRDDDGRPAVTASLADRCTDLPYRQDQAPAARGTPMRSDLGHDARLALPVIAVETASSPIVADRVERPTSRAPPRGAVPRRALAFILRC